MQVIAPRWTRGTLVLICHNARPPDAPKSSCGPHGAEALRAWLKKRLQEDGRWGPIRVVHTGCLDYCPHAGVCVAIQRHRGARECLVVDARTEREALYRKITE